MVANPPPGSLHGLPKLRLIQSLWAGVDRLLADATLPPGVPIARMVDPAMNAAMAETALWAVLALHRGFFDYARSSAPACGSSIAQRRADDVRVLVLGLGQMGRAVAARWRRRATASAAGACARRDVDAARRAAHAGMARWPRCWRTDIVVNLLPLTAGHARPAGRALLRRACRAAPASSTWRAARMWSMPTCWPRSTAAICSTRCSTCSTPSRCRPGTRSGPTRG